MSADPAAAASEAAGDVVRFIYSFAGSLAARGLRKEDPAQRPQLAGCHNKAEQNQTTRLLGRQVRDDRTPSECERSACTCVHIPYTHAHLRQVHAALHVASFTVDNIQQL